MNDKKIFLHKIMLFLFDTVLKRFPFKLKSNDE